MSTRKVTNIEIFEYSFEGVESFSANIVIDDKFLLQLGTDSDFDIPCAKLAVWNSDSDQDEARDTINVDQLVSELKIPTSKDELDCYLANN